MRVEGVGTRPVPTIIWCGPIYSQSGYGTVSRLFVRELDRLGARIKVINTGSFDVEALDPALHQRLKGLEQTELRPPTLCIVHGGPLTLRRIHSSGVDRTVLFTIFETDRIPYSWVSALNDDSLSEVWVPTEFNISTFSESGVLRSKLRKIRYGVQTPLPDKLSLKPDPHNFVFLAIARAGPRKGIDVLVEAFCHEFAVNEGATLRIHLTGPQSEIDAIKCKIESFSNPNIVLSTGSIPIGELVSLLESASIFVSTDKANGWSMPTMDAMARGIPTITVDWSGSTEYADALTTIPIIPQGLERVPINKLNFETSFMYLGHRWAKITTDEVRAKLRLAFISRDKLDLMAIAARTRLQELFSITKSCELILTIAQSVRNICRSPGGAPKIRVGTSIVEPVSVFLSFLINLGNFFREYGVKPSVDFILLQLQMHLAPKSLPKVR